MRQPALAFVYETLDASGSICISFVLQAFVESGGTEYLSDALHIVFVLPVTRIDANYVALVAAEDHALRGADLRCQEFADHDKTANDAPSLIDLIWRTENAPLPRNVAAVENLARSF